MFVKRIGSWFDHNKRILSDCGPYCFKLTCVSSLLVDRQPVHSVSICLSICLSALENAFTWIFREFLKTVSLCFSLIFFSHNLFSYNFLSFSVLWVCNNIIYLSFPACVFLSMSCCLFIFFSLSVFFNCLSVFWDYPIH